MASQVTVSVFTDLSDAIPFCPGFRSALAGQGKSEFRFALGQNGIPFYPGEKPG